MNQKPPIILICKAIPYDNGGSATVIRNLLANSSKGEFLVLGREPKTQIDFRKIELPYEYAVLPLSSGPENLLIKILSLFKSLLIALKITRKRKTEKIVGVYRDETSFILAYLVSLILNKELYVYLTDLYSENYSSRSKRMIQKVIFRRAKKIFCLNKAMEKHYFSIGLKNVEVIPSTIQTLAEFSPKQFDGLVFKIVFSGSIIYDRLDLLQTLVKNIGNNPDYELVFYAPHDEDFLKSNNLFASNVKIEYINNPALLVEMLKQAHLLYLPLTFHKPDSQRSLLQLKTCLGTKSYEYMQTGVPILVHSPAEYYTYQFFEESQSAVLLSSNGEGDLICKINYIKSNYNAFNLVVRNAHNQLSGHLSTPNYLRFLNLIKHN